MAMIKEGRYSHRFTGSAVDLLTHVHLVVGVGQLTVRAADSGGVNITGEHFTTTLRLAGTGGGVAHSRFKIDGTANADAGGGDIWHAKLRFIEVNPAKSADKLTILDAEFVFVASESPDQYWLISSKSTIVQGNLVNADEAVHGEVKWVSALGQTS